MNDYKDAINRRLYKGLIIVETAIHRVSCFNRTVLDVAQGFTTPESVNKVLRALVESMPQAANGETA
jgi:hypothetical protein